VFRGLLGGLDDRSVWAIVGETIRAEEDGNGAVGIALEAQEPDTRARSTRPLGTSREAKVWSIQMIAFVSCSHVAIQLWNVKIKLH
jgi:hypothetical protein